MPSMSLVGRLRFPNKRITLLLIIIPIIIFSLIRTESSPTLSFQSPGFNRTGSGWKPISCEPKAYQPDHPLGQLLTPPIGSPEMVAPWLPDNHRQFKQLCLCLKSDSCKPNQDRVVLLNSHHFKAWYYGSLDGRNGGESIWARSTLLALKEMGYTYLFSDSGPGLIMMHSLFPSHVVGIIMESDGVLNCYTDTKHCVKSPENPHGLPIWKLFSFYFWMNPAHPLGEKWVLSPEDYASAADDGRTGNTYLGYSVEPGCMKETFVPHADRPRGRVYAMSKRLSYFAPQPLRAWPVEFYTAAVNKIQTPGGVHFVIGAYNDTDFAKEYDLDIPELPAITNMGLLDQPAFHKEVAKSRVLVGVGRPYVSPSPYEALCFGVPFINPILMWDQENPNARLRWHTQHDGLKFHDPPYVYNVHKDDRGAFIAAIKNALENPIQRYIVPRMSMSAVGQRLHNILETDWKREAELLLAERMQTENGDLFAI